MPYHLKLFRGIERLLEEEKFFFCTSVIHIWNKMTDDKDILFMRGSSEDSWDDSALILAYDRAVNLAKEEIAKRMDSPSAQTKQKPQNSKHPNQSKKLFKKWSIGSPCRAVYSADGNNYEAIITKIYENTGMCMVKFVGYQNTEKVQLSSLLESNGLESQIAQEKFARVDMASKKNVDSDASSYSSRWSSKQANGERMDYDTDDHTGKFNPLQPNLMPGPAFDMSIDGMPSAPPLPPQLMAKLPESDADALSSMLMSWYISGFHTGYYHGLKQAKINQQKRRNFIRQ